MKNVNHRCCKVVSLALVFSAALHASLTIPNLPADSPYRIAFITTGGNTAQSINVQDYNVVNALWGAALDQPIYQNQNSGTVAYANATGTLPDGSSITLGLTNTAGSRWITWYQYQDPSNPVISISNPSSRLTVAVPAPSPTPEPGTLPALLGGAVLLGLAARIKRKGQRQDNRQA